MGRIVAIHQPNFFPWLGYFDKIARSDAFIILDDVQLQKTGGSWSNRVTLLVAGQSKWVTGPVDRAFHGTRTIREVTFARDGAWRIKLVKTITANYSRHPFFAETMEVIEPLILNAEPHVAEYNIHAITSVVERLGLDQTKIHRSSELEHHGTSNELLCSITKAVGGEVYMCGGGADAYQQEEVFLRSGLRLSYQNFTHPVYRQVNTGDFVAGLSIIDAAMNLGWHETAMLLKSGNG